MKCFVQVLTNVEIELDETKFTPQWISDFRRIMYPFEDITAHAEHIAQLATRGMLNKDFTEGYGRLADMGIKAKIMDQIVYIE